METLKRFNTHCLFAVLFATFALFAVMSGADPGFALVKIVVTYFGAVAALAFVAALITRQIKVKLRFHLGLYHGMDAAGMFYKGLFHKCLHGPQTWAWWQLFSLKYYPLHDVAIPSTGHRWWCYTRWGSLHFDVIFDRRKAYA